MAILVFLLLMVAGTAVGYAIVLNVAHNAIAKGAAPETSALRLLPEAVRRHAHERLLPGVPFVHRPARRAAAVLERVGIVIRPAPAETRSRKEMEAGKRALRAAVRADTPLYARAIALIGWIALLLLIALAITAAIWLAIVYVAGIFSRAIRG